MDCINKGKMQIKVNWNNSMKSIHVLTKRLFVGMCFLVVTQLFGQKTKIENYKRWKNVSEQLTAVKDNGVLLLRLQDFENSKHYVKSNYEKSTYKLYVKKIDRYNDVLESDVAKGFTFSKVYVFNSKRSKYVLSNEIENIEFIDPSTDETKFLNKDVPHIFAQIKDLKLSGSSNPLNFSSQRVIEILDHRLQKNKDVDLKQDFFYHSNTKDNKACSHVLEAAKKMSKQMEDLLITSKKKKKRLKKQILSKHAFRIKEYNKKISTMRKVKEEKITDQHRARLNKEIKGYQLKIEEIKRLEKALFNTD